MDSVIHLLNNQGLVNVNNKSVLVSDNLLNQLQIIWMDSGQTLIDSGEVLKDSGKIKMCRPSPTR